MSDAMHCVGLHPQHREGCAGQLESVTCRCQSSQERTSYSSRLVSCLDLEDPVRVIGRLPVPLLEPVANEREGYVPNVVYSCGAALHHGELIIPYAMSDYASAFATIPLQDVIDAMVRP